MTDSELSRFRAFISYSSQDRFSGRNFHSELERYRLPPALRMRAGGRRLGRIFRDRSDLSASAALSGALQEALRQSQFLIVLCSPAAARSRWVSEEIKYFAELGRIERVIPVLVSGLPSRWAADTAPDGAFPPALVDLLGHAEPFAPDLRDPVRGGDGLEMAKLKVISRLLDVPLDELTERHIAMVRADRRRARAITAIVSSLAIAATIGAVIAWTQTQAANRRLADVLASAAGQVQIASRLRDRYGVPSPVSKEFYEHAWLDLGRIEREVGDHPALLVEKARFALGMEAFSRDLGRTSERTEALQSAQASLAGLEDAERGFGNLVWGGPDPDAVAILQQRLSAATARLASDRGEDEEAVAVITGSVEQARAELEATGSELWRRELARSQCDLGDIHYVFSRYADAERAYADCRATMEAVPALARGVEDARLILDAMTQQGMIARARSDPPGALAAHREVAKKATVLTRRHAEASELMRLSAVAQGHLGDSLLGAGRDAAEAEAAYAKGREIAARLVATDPTRRDWQRDHFLLLERELTALQQTLPETAPEALSGRFDKAAGLLAEMEALSTRFLASDPDDAEQRFLHSVLLERRAILALSRFKHLGNLGVLQPTEDLAAAVDLRESLAAEAHDSISARYNAASIKLMAGRIHAGLSDRSAPALAYYNAAATGIADLIETEKLSDARDAREIANWEYDLALINYLRAGLYLRDGAATAAEQEIDAGSEILTRLAREYDTVPRFSAALEDLQALKDSIDGSRQFKMKGTDP